MATRKRLWRRAARVERLEDRRVLTAATFAEVSASLGLGGLQGGSGEFHGGGLTFADLNEDGYADLYLIGPTSRGNRVYVNVDDGSGGRTFQRLEGDGGAGYPLGDSVGAIAADYDNDGDLDVYVANYNRANVLYRNMWREDHPGGGGDPLDLRFVNVTSLTDPTPDNPIDDVQFGVGLARFANPDPEFGFQVLDNTMSAAWADVNRDGWVDLYVGSWDGTNGDPGTAEDGQLGERDTLYLNNGDGTFTDVTMGPDGGVAAAEPLLVDGSLEEALAPDGPGAWSLTGAAQVQPASWASSDRANGLWFQGFQGAPGSPANATLTQTVTVPDAGEYTLRFDARVEANFPAVVGAFRATLHSDETGATASVDLLAASPNNDFNTHTLTLAGVPAGDRLTVTVEMIDSVGGVGPALSAMADAFYLRGPADAPGWRQVGGWEYADGSINDPTLPAEFSGQNALQFADFNNDGWQDLIVATMGGGGVGPNRDMLYLNRGVDAGGEWLGYELVSYDLGFGGNESSDMGVAVADVDNDGDLDYFSTLLPDAHPLWINDLESGELGFTKTELTNTFAWGANFHDFDNNGRVDLLVGTANSRRSFLHMQDLDGSFTERGVSAGLTSTYATRGVAVADYDRDGDGDAALWAINAASPGIQLYRNDTPSLGAGHRFLVLELEGDPTLPGPLRSTRDAIGARAYVTADLNGDGEIGADESRIEEVLSGHSNGATTSSLALEFGLGQADRADVTIVWGSGRTTTLRGVAADQFLEINESATNVDTLLGDYNADRTVNAEDYTVWRDQVGQSTAPFTEADGSGDGAITEADAAIWRANFGLTAPVVATAQAEVPEPTQARAREAAFEVFGDDEDARRERSREDRPARRGRLADRALLLAGFEQSAARSDADAGDASDTERQTRSQRREPRRGERDAGIETGVAPFRTVRNG